MTPVFIDTSYLLALELANDQNHPAAVGHWQQAVKALPGLVTTAYVFDEVVTFFNSRGFHTKAIEVGNTLLRSASIQMIHVDESLFHDGWLYLVQHHDKDYSLTGLHLVRGNAKAWDQAQRIPSIVILPKPGSPKSHKVGSR